MTSQILWDARLEKFCMTYVRPIYWASRVIGAAVIGYAIYLCVAALIFMYRTGAHGDWFWRVWLLGLSAIAIDFVGNMVLLVGNALMKMAREKSARA